MSISRVYQAIPLAAHARVQLDAAATHHIARVMRAQVGDKLILFNGQGQEFAGLITHIDKKTVTVELKECIERRVESSLELCLAQGISRGEKMDYTIQKAVELGVKKIIPLLTERCNVKLDTERREKRLQHWQSVVVSACEQSGRSHLPELASPQALTPFLAEAAADVKFVLAPGAEKKLTDHSIDKSARVILLIGPEGGLSDQEIDAARQHGFLPLNLGPRILRTETAAVAAISVLQFYAGDLG